MSPYSADLPLRTTAVWGAFRDLRVIPHRYGDTEGECLPYDEGRRVFVWCDHASVQVRDVMVEAQSVFDWQARNGQDSTGRSVTFIEFTNPVDEGVTVTASGLAKADSRTGAVITNPADVVLDILANIAGHSVTGADVELFRAECAARGLAVAGSLNEAISTQRAVAAVCASVGAVFCPTMEGLARIYPGGDLEAFEAAQIGADVRVGAEAGLDAIANAVVVQFDWADGAARQAIEVDAPDSIADLGRRELVFEARWLADPRGAYDLATRLLRQRARPVWNITAEDVAGVSSLRRLAVGQTVRVDHPALPVSGTALVLGCDLDPVTDRCRLELAIPAGAAPRVRLVRTSAAIDPMQYAAVGVLTQGDSRVLNLRDADGGPLADAAVTLNGQWTRYTDAGGRVLFPVTLMPAGTHQIEVVTGDGQTLTVQVVVQ